MAYYMYVSIQEEDRIAIFSMTPKTGKLKHLGDAELKGRPAPLAIDPDRKYLFAGRRKADDFGMTSFSIDRKTGGLSPIGSIPLQGDPVHISTDKTGKFLLSAYYYQKTAAVHSIGDDGALADPPVVWRETDIGAHYIQTDPANRYAFVPHIAEGAMTGANAIFQFRFDEKTGAIAETKFDGAKLEPGSGPRHFGFHPDGKFAYVINEIKQTVTAFRYRAKRGRLKTLQTVSTVPHSVEGNSTAEVLVHPSGKFLYGSNRGHNSIAMFRINEKSGKLTALGHESTRGSTPRNFGIDPTGQFLLAANQQSDNVAVFRIDQDTGKLKFTGNEIKLSKPVCVRMILQK